MIRAVLDANVFVSAIINPKGIPGKIFTAWQAEQFQLVLSEAILAEIVRVLCYPKIIRRHGWSEEKLRTFVDDLAHLAILTPGKLKLTVIREDPPDDRYLGCAIEGEAEYIVSGDQLLLSLGDYRGIRVLTPRAFVESLKQQLMG